MIIKKKILFILLFLVMVPALYSKTYQEFLLQGDEKYSSFDNQSALENYLQAYKLSPDNYDVLFRLSRTYNDRGEEFYEYHEMDSSRTMIDYALQYSEKLVKNYPDSAASYAFLAMSYGNEAMHAGGKEEIKLAHKIEENAKKSLSLDPNQYLSYVILGIYYRKIADLSWFERMFANTFFGSVPEGSYEESIQMFKKAMDLYPKTIVASFQLALTYETMGDKGNETELLKKLLTYPEQNFRDRFAIEKAKRKLQELN